MKSIIDKDTVFESAYRLIEGLLHNPEELNLDKILKTSKETLEDIERTLSNDASSLLSSFLKEFGSVSGDYYVKTFELSPECPLYLGYYLFEEPTTCAGVGTSGRNMYMIELINIYRHLGLEMDVKEMPDYLPVMIEFLCLSLQRKEDPIREKFIKEYLMPALPEIVNRLKTLGSPYLNLIKAFQFIVQAEGV